MHRLLRIKLNNYKKQISHTIHRLDVGQTPWSKILFKIRSKVRILLDLSKIRGCGKNCLSNARRSLRVQGDAIQVNQCPCYFPSNYESTLSALLKEVCTSLF
jgi:hypothetical protein